jgi:hypothetical protein
MEQTVMELKYFKPKSITWWGSVVPLACGLFIAFEPTHGLSGLAASLDAATGGIGPYALINLGLVGVGLRGAVK